MPKSPARHRRIHFYDWIMGALCVWREARGSTKNQMLCVWWVILNRTMDPAGRWPRTVSDVVTEPEQFSSFNPKDPNSTVFPTRRDAPDWDAFLNCLLVVFNPLGTDPTAGANSFHTTPDSEPFPSWADPAKLTLTLEPFKFYRL